MSGPVNAASVIELLADPQRTARLAERERAARRGAPGFFGITPRENPQVRMFDDDTVEAEVNSRFRCPVRTGNLVKPIYVPGHGRVPLRDIPALALPVGTLVGVEYCDPTASGARAKWMLTEISLMPWPRIRPWETRPRVEPGERVLKNDRRKFVAEMFFYLRDVIPAPSADLGKDRRTSWLVLFSYLTFMVLVRDNNENPGVWGRQVDIADELRLSARSINDFHQILSWFGILKRLSYPTPNRDSNLYQICWPQRHVSAPQPKPVPPPPESTIRRARLDRVRTSRPEGAA
jgi:hypothetical protein